ncbi:MAG: twin-arginine translocase TatA/TatE family subunit [Planctomycetota bacterium]
MEAVMPMDWAILGLIGPIGWPELLVIGLVMLLLFGRRLPEVARSLGDGIREFKKGVKETTPDWNDSSRVTASPTPTSIGSGDERRVAHGSVEPVEESASAKSSSD